MRHVHDVLILSLGRAPGGFRALHQGLGGVFVAVVTWWCPRSVLKRERDDGQQDQGTTAQRSEQLPHGAAHVAA